jgi:hypothetical protein
MFDALDRIDRGQRQEDQDEERRLQFMAGNPDAARARMSYEMAGLAGKGLAQAGSAMAGLDPRSRTERDVDNVTAAKAAIAELPEVDLTTPAGVDAYYKGVIGALRKHNLPAEAHAASVEWNKERNALTDRNIKQKDLDRKITDDARKHELGVLRIASAEQIAAAKNATAADIADAKLTAAQLQTGPFKSVDYQDHIEVINRFGEVISSKPKAQKPLSAKDQGKADDAETASRAAYQTDMQGLQTVYKAAADLYNSPGLDELIGKWTGIAAEQGPEKGGPFREMFIARLGPRGQEALGLFQQVQGASFIKALKDLKAAGKGSTGLGAVSEVEGNKIQAANGALFPRQQPESFRRKLAAFIETIEASAHILGTKAQEDKIEPIYLNTVQLTGPGRRGAPPAEAPTTPRPGTGGAQSGEPTVTMTKDGKTRQVYRSKVEEAKRRGYTETK